MSAVLVPPSERLLPAAPRGISIGIDPTEPMPLSLPRPQGPAMDAASSARLLPSRWQAWRALEPRVDRLASLAALGLGLVGLVGLLVL